MNVLEARDLGKRYGRRWALKDLTLDVPGGRIVALVGPNGAGKTTFLQLAMGFATPQTITADICTELAVTPLPPAPLPRSSSACCSFRACMTASENDRLGRTGVV